MLQIHVDNFLNWPRCERRTSNLDGVMIATFSADEPRGLEALS